MHPDLKRIKMVDAYDRAVTVLKKEKRALIDELAAAEAHYQESQEAIVAMADELATLKKRQHELARLVESYEHRRQSAERVLAGGGGDPEAAERQIASVDDLIDTYETEILEIMEQTESLTSKRDAAVKQLTQDAEDLSALQERQPIGIAKLRAEYDRIHPLREQVFNELDHTIRDKYSVLWSRKGRAATEIERGACHSCRMVVQPQHIADLKRGLLRPCQGCGRWLIPEES